MDFVSVDIWKAEFRIAIPASNSQPSFRPSMTFQDIAKVRSALSGLARLFLEPLKLS